MWILILVAPLISSVCTSFCGDSAIPYSFEVLNDGQPILGCARPTCFGWSTSGLPASQSASFYRIHKKPDGFLRKERASIPPFELGDIHFYHPQTSECEETFSSTTCDEDDQWVGGIAPLPNVSSVPLALQCCRFEPLKLSVDRGVASVSPGQIVVGGEVSKKGRQFAFDYIAGLAKFIQDDGSVVYDVSIRRFPCLPLPNKAFQAPTVEVATPISLQNDIEGPFLENTEQRAPVTPVPAAPTPAQQFFQNQIQLQPQPQFQPQPQLPMAMFQSAPYVPYYNPGTSGAYYCFSADTTVMTIDNVPKRMDELKVGDWIQTIEQDQVVYSMMILWLHRNPQQKAIFHKITLEDGRILKLTGKHFIFKTECFANSDVLLKNIGYEAVFAETIEEGDCLYTEYEKRKMKMRKVTKVEKITETGIYSPLVSQGRLMVNGVLASCHSVVQSNTLQQTFFSYVDHFFSITQWLFGNFTSDIRELPIGIDVLTSLMDQILPKNLVTM